MNAINGFFADIVYFIKTRKMRNEVSKKSLIIFVILIVGFGMLFYLTSGNNGGLINADNDSFSTGFINSQEQQDDNKDYQAPPLDKQENMELDNNALVPPVVNNNPFVAQDTDKADASQIPDLSGQNLLQQEQQEMINQIAKKQKPDDMIAFLKEIQNKFDFLKTQQRFKYDLKDYKVGDIFLWWEIEEITPIYIRFKEEQYSYNLRFLDGFER